MSEATVGAATWQDALDGMKADLLKRVDELTGEPTFVDAIPRGRQDADKLGDNQWRGLVAAAREAQTMAEVKALLRYKVGKERSGRPKGWAINLGRRGAIGLAVVQDLEEIENLAAARCPSGDEPQHLALQAAARYFGYMAWKVVSLRPERTGGG